MNAGPALLLTLLFVVPVAAPSALAEMAFPEEPLEEVLVIGQQAGPGLWRVTHPEAAIGHVLWILGTYGPLPKKMTWRSAELESVLAESQELLGPGSVDAKVGPLGGVTLLPSLIGVRDNPNGQRLQDVLPPDLYARWLALKERYLDEDDDVERWRPIFAAQELYTEALEQTGFEPYGGVWPQVQKLARRAGVKVITPEVEFKVEKPRAAIREFKQTSLADVECFARTIQRLESDLELMRVRANAWATGNVARLRELAPVDRASACIGVVLDSQLMRDRGISELPERVGAAWVDAAEAALARNKSTVGVLSIEQILKPDGLVARLKAKGYVVEDP